MIYLGTAWATGAMHGYTLKEQGLPTTYKYATLSLVTVMQMARTLGAEKSIGQLRSHPASTIAGIFVGIPIFVGTVFCTGHFFGKSVRHTYESIKGSKLE
jgi:hypothetical protein